MALDRKEQTGGQWNGVKDLSGALRLLWDDRGLYFCLQVTDDVHAAPHAEKDFWENDCCQFAFDPYMNGPEGTYDAREISLWVSDTPEGPKMDAIACPACPVRKRGSLKTVLSKCPSSMTARACTSGC